MFLNGFQPFAHFLQNIFANLQILKFFFHYYLNILFCIKCLEKIPDFETLRFNFAKRATSGRILFLREFLYIFKILPHQYSGWTSVDIFRKSKYCECFFLEIYNFFSNCEIRILIFGVDESPMSDTHQLI